MRLAPRPRALSRPRSLRRAGAGLVVSSLLGGLGAAGCATPVAAAHKVLVIVEENHPAGAVRSRMPYLASLAARYGYAADYVAAAHPSLPNYLAMTAGSTFGITKDLPPTGHRIAATSVFATGGRSYEQGMSMNCQQVGSGAYTVNHNPLAYYANESLYCLADDRPTSSFAADLQQGLAAVSLVTPDLSYDAHDGTLAQADAFLRYTVPQVMAGPDYRAGKLTIVITFDEGVGLNQHVSTAVINPRLHAKTVRTPLNHYSLARWLYRVAGIRPQNAAASAVDMGTTFGL